jgi:3-oxoacyl-[acyl-carrier-protein] synthase-3
VRRSIDLIIVATSTPDYIFPSTACLLQAKLGVKGCAAFDVQAVLQRLRLCASPLRTLHQRRTRKAWWSAPRCSRASSTGTTAAPACLFGDGAGAWFWLLRTTRHPRQPSARRRQPGRHAVRARQRLRGRSIRLAVPADERPGVFKFAVRVLDESARETVAAAGMRLADIDWLIPHQANVRILEATARKLGCRARSWS